MSTKARASGKTPAEEEAEAEARTLDENPTQEDPAEETTIRFRTPGFARMRLEWRGEDGLMLASVQASVDQRILDNFSDAFSIMHEVFEVVRTPELDDHGDPKLDRYGFTKWKRTPSGSWEEDWSRLTRKERENFLFEITTRIFQWSQLAADAWAEAMFAKGIYEERFSHAYDAPMTGTIEDRTAVGKVKAAEDRYFAIFVSYYSRKADAIVRSMELLSQRLKDALQIT